MGVIPVQPWRLLRWHLHRVMQRLTGRGHHTQDIILRRIWRHVQTVEVKICHLHARMSETILFRMSGELVLILHIQSASRLYPNYRWRVVPLITKFGFAGDWIRRGLKCHRRACLRQFRKYSALSISSSDEQSDACYAARGGDREFKNLHSTKIPAGDC